MIFAHIAGLPDILKNKLIETYSKTNYIFQDLEVFTEKIIQDKNMKALIQRYEYYCEKSKNPDYEKCKCTEDGKYWDYYEVVTGTFIAHPESPWEGLKGKLHQHGHSTQRGWGANLFNLKYGLASWMAVVIEQKPYKKSEVCDLRLGACYSSIFNFDLDECNYLTPKTQVKSKPDYDKCNPQMWSWCINTVWCLY